MLVLLAHPWRTHSRKAIHNQLDVVLLKVMHKLFKLLLSSQQWWWYCSICHCHCRSLRSFESMLELAIISFKNTRKENCIHATTFKNISFFNYIVKGWAFVWSFIWKYGIDENLMNLHFPTFLWVNDEPSLDIFHIEDGLVEYLRSNFLIVGDVNDLVDSFLSFPACKVENPVIKPCFFEFSKLVLDPQIRLFICTVLIKLGLVEGEVVMIVLGVEARSFETDNKFFSISWIFDQVINGKILSDLADDRSRDIVALPVVRVVVTIQEFDCLLGVISPALEADQ